MESYITELINNNWITEQDDIERLFPQELREIIKNWDENCRPIDVNDIFNSFKGLKPEDVKVLILGQDPYPDYRRAHGLAFSFKDGNLKPSASLKNIFCKIKQDLGIENTYTNLTCWKKQGVLLLNTSLTLKKVKDINEQNKTKKQHVKLWSAFLNHIIEKLIETKNNTNTDLTIMLWGTNANNIEPIAYGADKKYNNVKILRSSHPSNLGQACKTKIFNGDVPAFLDEDYQPFKECNFIDWHTY